MGCIVCTEEDMDLSQLSVHYLTEHTITFTEEYEDDLETFQEKAKQFPNDYQPINNISSDKDQISDTEISDIEAFFYYEKPKSGSSSDSSSSIKSSRSKGRKHSSDSSSSINSNKSNGRKNPKSKASRDHDSLRAQFSSQKNLYENKFKEMDSSLKAISEINEKILANQIKEEEVKTTNKNNFKEIKSSINQINKVNEEILAIQIKKDEITDHSKDIKSIEDTLAANTMKNKNKEKKNKRKEFR